MLNVANKPFMLSVTILNVVLLSVVEPPQGLVSQKLYGRN
jgi:hypothetical protein